MKKSTAVIFAGCLITACLSACGPLPPNSNVSGQVFVGSGINFGTPFINAISGPSGGFGPPPPGPGFGPPPPGGPGPGPGMPPPPGGPGPGMPPPPPPGPP